VSIAVEPAERMGVAGSSKGLVSKGAWEAQDIRLAHEYREESRSLLKLLDDRTMRRSRQRESSGSCE
jgi:hypothetical protein